MSALESFAGWYVASRAAACNEHESDCMSDCVRIAIRPPKIDADAFLSRQASAHARLFGAARPQQGTSRRPAHTCRQVNRLSRSAELALVTAQVAGHMPPEHAVGESIVVPGLKLTDHIFQVGCADNTWMYLSRVDNRNCNSGHPAVAL